MYIPYDKIFQSIALFLPVKSRESTRLFGVELKARANLNYIKRNRKKVLKNLNLKLQKGEKLNVAFFIYDERKWKAQSLYDLMEKSKEFIPHIFVSKNCSPKENFNYQKKEELEKIYNFFKNKNMRVLYAYDFKKDDYIAFSKRPVQPDIIIYCHPWYVYKSQGPVMTSTFAISCYIPYFLATSIDPSDFSSPTVSTAINSLGICSKSGLNDSKHFSTVSIRFETSIEIVTRHSVVFTLEKNFFLGNSSTHVSKLITSSLTISKKSW